MSYDLYCYKSQLGKPDLEEAQNAIEVEEDHEVEAEPEIKLNISKALMDYNQRLERFEFDYEEIARLQGISIEEAKGKFNHIELNTPEDDLATQITIFDNYVSITVPCWYAGNKAKDVFRKVTDYTKIIRQTAGYFVYDPQVENAYDPLTQDFDGLAIYQSMSEQVAQLKKDQSGSTDKKPWWKFW
jgi:hypothetical protein